MSCQNIPTIETAPEASKPLLEAVQNEFGFVPNVLGHLADSPQALESYLKLTELLGQSSLSPAEQQVAILAISYANNCEYCMGAHTTVAGMVGVPQDVIDALRDGTPITSDARLEALRTFAGDLVEKCGWLDQADLQAFMDAGYKKQNALDVLVAVAAKTITNYTNHIAGTPLDALFQPHAWKKPEGK